MGLVMAVCMAVGLAVYMVLAGSAVAQSQNAAETGSGGPMNNLEDLKSEWNKLYDGTPGRVFKGAVGLAGMAAALMAASDAVNFKVQVNGDGSVDSGSNVSSSTSTSSAVSTTGTTSSSTSTN